MRLYLALKILERQRPILVVIDKQFGQEHGVLVLIVLNFLTEILVFLNFFVECNCGLE